MDLCHVLVDLAYQFVHGRPPTEPEYAEIFSQMEETHWHGLIDAVRKQESRDESGRWTETTHSPTPSW